MNKLTFLGKHHTKESIEKIRESHLGFKHTVETKKKMSLAKKNKPLSEKQKQNLLAMQSKNIGRKNPASEKTKQKISKSLTGRQLSETHKLNISIGNKGKIHTIEHNTKIGKSQSGNKNHNWKVELLQKDTWLEEEWIIIFGKMVFLLEMIILVNDVVVTAENYTLIIFVVFLNIQNCV